MRKSKYKWAIENENQVSFQLDEHHKFYVERTSSGFVLKMFAQRGHEHKPEEPILLYIGGISDSQLGLQKK